MDYMPKVKVNDIEMYYEMTDFTNPWEEPETLVLIHGYSSNAKFWFPQVPAFCKEFKVITIDNRGHGRTTIPKKGWTIKTMASDLRALLDKLKIDKAHLLGHSMGGCIAQQFALNYSERVKGLILFSTFSQPLDPPLDWDSLKQIFTTVGLSEAVEQFAPMMFSPNVDKDLLEWTKNEMKSAGLPYIGKMLEVLLDFSESLYSTFNITNQLRNIRAPTLVIVGRNDVNTPPKFSEILHKNIPDSELALMSGLHNCYLEYPEEFNKIVLEFLRKLKA